LNHREGEEWQDNHDKWIFIPSLFKLKFY
jgi:hypothetical protein